MRKSWKWVWAACLASAAAFADGAPAPQSGLYVGPEIGTGLLDFNWPGGSSYGTELTPSLRLSLFSPRFALGADVGLSTSLAPFSGYYNASLNLGGEVMPYLTTWGSTRTYGMGGLNVGMEFSANPSRSGVYPKAGFTLGLGIQDFLTPQYGLGAEVGLRTQFVFGGVAVEPTTTLYVSLVGMWDPWLRTVEKVPEVTVAPPIALTPPEEKPPLYGHSEHRPCATYAVDGWFEPSQGVWQDDPSFEDKKGKQLTRLPEDQGIAYDAELEMAMNKDTALFGVQHYRKVDGERVDVNDRNDIVLMGFSNCPTQIPVKFKFTSKSAIASKLIYTSQVIAQIPLEGEGGLEFKPWTAMLPAPAGVPEKPFRFELELPFQLKAELMRENGDPTGLEMTVRGRAKPTIGPKTHFVPVLLSPAKEGDEESLIRRTQLLADETAKYAPDVYPIPPDGLPTDVRVIRNFTDKDIPGKWLSFRRYEALVGALNDTLAATTFLDGAGRVVAVMSGEDFEALFGKGYAGMTVDTSVDIKPKGENAQKYKQGLSLSWKVMLMPRYETWDTVAHELLHTLPEGWADSEMKSECGINYHNKEDPIAHGVKIDDGGQPAAPRRLMNSKIALVGPEEGIEKIWITQCSFWHLLKLLGGGPPDPPVVMLRAWLGKKGAKVQGELRPIYQLMGHSDLAPGKKGPFAFVLRDAKGAELGRFPFTPVWTNSETGAAREVTSGVYRVPDLPGWTQVELVGPGGVLDHRALSAKEPELTITAPADMGQAKVEKGRIHVAWEAQGAPGATLLYSVLYSRDGGKNWTDQAFEQKETAFELLINPKGHDHQVKIVVTDGTRSAEAVTRFVPRL